MTTGGGTVLGSGVATGGRGLVAGTLVSLPAPPPPQAVRKHRARAACRHETVFPCLGTPGRCVWTIENRRSGPVDPRLRSVPGLDFGAG